MTIKTKNVFAQPEGSDGERYLITRLYAARPKSMKECRIDKWIRDLAPSKELLYDYLHRHISTRQYTRRFTQEIDSNPKAQETLDILRTKVKQGITVTLLCKCAEGVFCHRNIVKDMLERS
ncbi:MAG TPA: DUF488 family protein [Nitrososphaera sp.]|jgi:uncharacterized protein YeaO (DUF488 family)|nr:DUF488 family protein [Nitrososphaera sp.]